MWIGDSLPLLWQHLGFPQTTVLNALCHLHALLPHVRSCRCVRADEGKLSGDHKCQGSLLLPPYTLCWKKEEGEKEKLLLLVCFLSLNPTGGARWAPEVLCEHSFCRYRRNTSYPTLKGALLLPPIPPQTVENMDNEHISKPE